VERALNDMELETSAAAGTMLPPPSLVPEKVIGPLALDAGPMLGALDAAHSSPSGCPAMGQRGPDNYPSGEGLELHPQAERMSPVLAALEEDDALSERPTDERRQATVDDLFATLSAPLLVQQPQRRPRQRKFST